MLYFMALGWAVRKYGLDEKAGRAVHTALRGLMREAAQISLEVTSQPAALEGQGWLYVRQSDGEPWPWDRGVFYMPLSIESGSPVVVPPNG